MYIHAENQLLPSDGVGDNGILCHYYCGYTLSSNYIFTDNQKERQDLEDQEATKVGRVGLSQLITYI